MPRRSVDQPAGRSVDWSGRCFQALIIKHSLGNLVRLSPSICDHRGRHLSYARINFDRDPEEDVGVCHFVGVLAGNTGAWKTSKSTSILPVNSSQNYRSRN